MDFATDLLQFLLRDKSAAKSAPISLDLSTRILVCDPIPANVSLVTYFKLGTNKTIEEKQGS